jgi:Zn-dependent protease
MPEISAAQLWVIPAFLLALTVHEFAHALIAERMGDPTARMMGRVTLNPLPHIDPIGTVILPAVLIIAGSPFVFGWAKPVPVNPHNLRNPKRDMIWISLAGPAANLVFAFVCGLLLRVVFVFSESGPLVFVLAWAVMVGLVLAAFNLIPVPPLDGSGILKGLLPDSMQEGYAKYERYGFLILLGLFTLGQSIISLIVGPFVGIFLWLFTGKSMFFIFKLMGVWR